MIDIDLLVKKIDEHQVISFDVYDTLLLRPFSLPSDLFKYIEDKYEIDGFCKARNSVKVPHNREKTIEDIYSNISDDYKECIKYELKEEHDLVYVNPIIRDAYEYAKGKNKIIIIVSDIYFHEEYLTKILNDNGIDNFSKIYCSCDYQKTKCEGNLFDQVVSDLHVSARDILHIGDNEISDYAVPKSKGLDSFLIAQNYSCYREYRGYLPIKYDHYWDSIINKVCADNFSQISRSGNCERDVWYRFGHDVAGPICWTFAKWIRDNVDNNIVSFSDIAFVARDGYLIKKMFDQLPEKKHVGSHYVYAPRILTTLLQETYEDEKNVQRLSDDEKDVINNVYDLAAFGDDERTAYIIKLSNAYRDYLSKEEFGKGSIGVVDSTTNYLSSQKLIDNYTNNDTCGLYWFASEYAFSKKSKMLTCQKEHYIVVESVDLFELIFKSPEPTIKSFSLSGNIEFNSPDANEIKRIENFSSIEEGALDFFERIEKMRITGYPSADLINNYLIRYCMNPLQGEREYIENGESSGGIANRILEPTKVFIDINKSVTPRSILKELKKKIVKHPKLFILLRNIYHTVKR